MARRSGTKQRQMQCSTGNVCSRLLHNTYQPQAHQGPQKDPGAPQTTQKGEHIHPTTKPSENPSTPTRAPRQEREGQGPQLGRETVPKRPRRGNIFTPPPNPPRIPAPPPEPPYRKGKDRVHNSGGRLRHHRSLSPRREGSKERATPAWPPEGPQRGKTQNPQEGGAPAREAQGADDAPHHLWA